MITKMAVDEATLKVFGELMKTNPLEQFRVLFAQGFVGMSVSAIMQMRLNFVDAPVDSRRSWWNGWLYLSGDGVAQHPDQRTKLVLDVPWYALLNSNSVIEGGGLVLEDDQFNGLPGREFHKMQVRRYAGDLVTEADYTPNAVRANPFWQFFARRQDRLNLYADFAQQFTDEHFHRENMPVMDISIDADAPQRPTIWPVVFYGIHLDAVAAGYMSTVSGLAVTTLDARCNLPIGIKPEEHRLLLEDDPMWGYLRLQRDHAA